ncbi:MAG: type VI secretion system tip protein VgrG [Kiritimatiellaeota bacterium]|nr:type VI secretion system tip protein VgrG [Kiritimatiellota bacterium]
MASQKNRHMAIVIDLGDKGKSTGSGEDDVLLLRGLRGTSGISDSFSYELELLSHDNNLGNSPLHKNATIVFRDQEGSPKRYINGEIFEFAVCGMAFIPRENVDERLFLYKARLAPALEELKHSCRTKIHTGESVKDIVDGVFSQAATTNFGYSNPLPQNYCDSSKLSASYKKLACCVQYQESDFDFVSRLMQSEGISYYFTHQQGSHTMVLIEKNSDFQTHSKNIDYDYSNINAGVYSFTQNERLIPYSTDTYPKSRDFSYRLMDNSHNGDLGDVSGDPNAIYNVYADSARFLDKKEEMDARLTSFKQFLRERSVVEKYDWSGNTHWIDVDSGMKFVMNKFPVGGAPGVNILVCQTSTTSSCRYDLDGPGMQPIEDYENIFDMRFQAMDSNKTFRPAMNTSKPKVYGLQTGIIITNTGDAKNVTESDEFARVKVKPHWGDSTATNGDEFCWARVARDRANNGHGLFSLPRVGEEVVVSFVNGDLEEPLVVGSVYNSHCKPPMAISSTSNNQPDMLLRSRQVSKNNTWNESDAVVAQSAPVDEIDMSELKKEDERKGYHEISLSDTEESERVGLYSNGEILAQAPEDIVVKAGKKIMIEAGEEIELKVGSTTLVMKEEEVHIKRGINSDFRMSNLSIDLHSWEITINGILGAKLKSLMSSVMCEPLSVDIFGLETSTKAGLMNIGTIKSFIAAGFGFPKMLGMGSDTSENVEFGINMLFTASSLMLLREGKALLGASFISQAGSEVKIEAGFASIFGFPVPALVPGDMTIMTTELHKRVLGEEDEEVVEHEEVVVEHQEQRVQDDGVVVDEDHAAVEQDAVVVGRDEAVVEHAEAIVAREADAVAEERNAAAVAVVVAAQDEDIAVDERAIAVESRDAGVENVADGVQLTE